MQIGNIQGRTHRLPATRSACPRNGSDPDGRSRRELTSAGWRRVSLPVAAGREREIDEEPQRTKAGMAKQARDWQANLDRKSVVEGKGGSVRVDQWGGRILKKKKK